MGNVGGNTRGAPAKPFLWLGKEKASPAAPPLIFVQMELIPL